jgi:tetratricopeptide (TPR) repeat protein/capsular polysaccharide biosynthesis protein
MMQGEPLIKTVKSYLAQGQWNEVIELCNDLLAKNRHQIELYPLLAKAYTKQGQISQAIAVYQKTIGSQLNQAEVYAELGLLYSKQQQLTEAARYYQQALSLKPDWAELQYNLAVILHQLGNWEAAIRSYRQALAIKPDYAAVYFNLGVLHDQRGELEVAVENYERAIELQANFIRAYSNLGSTFAKQKKYHLAIDIFQEGLKLNPTWATLHNNLGQVYWFDGKPELAKASFERAILLEPTMSLVYHNLGKLWQQRGNYTNAIECFKQVVELEPDNVLAHSHYAEALLKIGQLKSAIDSLRQSIILQPTFVQPYIARAFATEARDLLEMARLSCAKFLDALAKQLDYPDIYQHLGQTYFYLGDILFEYGGIRQAEIYYQQALQINPADVELYLRLGNCLAKQQRLNAAIAIYQMGLTLQPTHPQICFQLGKILEKQQAAEEAIDYYEVVLKQKLDRLEEWERLPNLFLSEDNLSLLPQAIYHHTQDWARDCQINDFSYAQVTWGDTGQPVRITGKREPESIAIASIGQKAALDCAGVNCNSCMGKLIEYFEPVSLGNNAYKCSFNRQLPVAAPLPFVVTLPNGRAWIAPQKNSWIICNAIAVMTPDGYLLGDLSRFYPWFLPGCPYQEKTNHPLLDLETIPPLESIDGTVALLSGLAGHVYYHWMFDILPRLELMTRSGIELEKIDWFVINNCELPFQRETLDILGIPSAKILPSDRHSHIQAKELIVPSFPGYLDWVPDGTIKFLRQTFLSKISLTKVNYGKRIYISRARAKSRQIINETEVFDLIKQYGFQTVFLEEMSFLEQVAVFANAEAIVAPHGSGLTNIVFCSPHTKIIELFSPHYIRTDYWMLGQHLQLEHYYSIGEVFDCSTLRHLMYQNALAEDIAVNLSSLALILKTAGIIP